MITLQLALTLLLVAGAGLMVKSMWRLTSHPAGFTPEQILTMRMDFKGAAVRDRHGAPISAVSPGFGPLLSAILRSWIPQGCPGQC